MRKRTWWQIAFLDGQASKLAGAPAGSSAWLVDFDVKPPLSVSDSDLSPNMKEPPVEKEGATEMLFCSLRYEVARSVLDSGTSTKRDGDQRHRPMGLDVIAEKDKAIDALEARLQQKFVRYCDPSIPLHLLTIFVSKSVICTMRIMAHHPRQYPDKGASMSQSERDMLLRESLRELEISALGKSEKAIRGFLWHIQVYSHLGAFIYVLSELRYRHLGDEVERAWKQVEITYEQRPEMLAETKNRLHFAIGNLALKAWAKREEFGCVPQGNQLIPPPRFISILRSQRRIPEPSALRPSNEFQQLHHQYSKPNADDSVNRLHSDSGFHSSQQQWENNSYIAMEHMMMSDTAAFDWEYYQTMLDGDLPAYAG